VSPGLRYYGLLLRLLPPEFRETRGADVLAVFEEMRGEHAVGDGPVATARFYVALTFDVIRRMGPERERIRRRRRRGAAAPERSLAGRTGKARGQRFETLVTDIRHAFRRMARSPGFTTTALLSL